MPEKIEEQNQTPVEEVVETSEAPVVEEKKEEKAEETTEEKKPAKKKTEVDKSTKSSETKVSKTTKKATKKKVESKDETTDEKADKVVEEKVEETTQEKAEPVEEKKEKTTEKKAEEESEFDDEGKLVPTDTYLKTGIHVGTKFKTAHMKQFIYKTRPDGLSVLNVDKIDQYIQLSFNLLKTYQPEEILVVCRRENGWKPVKLLEAMSGMRVFAGRYPPGILTNSGLEDFIEAKVMIVVDAWADRNAVNDAIKCGIPVVALCDTNNQCNNIDLVVPCNNKGRKSLGLYFYLLAKEYMLAKGMIQKEEDMQYKLEDFLED